MRAEAYTPRGEKKKRSDDPNFVPYRGTVTPSYSVTREQAKFIKQHGGSKFIRALIERAMGVNNG